MAERDPYEVLGLESDATPEQIRAAFRRTIRSSHPDTASESEGPDVQSVMDAYRLLSDPSTRADLDSALSSRGRRIEVSRRRSRIREGSGARGGPCRVCQGSGTVRDVRICPACQGRAETTRLDGRVARVVRCRICVGRGRLESVRQCSACAGTGKTSQA